MSDSRSNPSSSEQAASCERIAIEAGGLRLWRDAFAAESAALQAALRDTIAWEQHRIRLFGRAIDAPRLSAWHADPGCDYRYSGLQLAARPLPPLLEDLRLRIAALTGLRFDSVLLNRYRDGNDSMGWHADDERELGPAPVIASLSLGATRRFLLRRRGDARQRLALELPAGSLLLMEPPLQANWLHAVPKTRRPVGERINLTWRQIRSREPSPLA